VTLVNIKNVILYDGYQHVVGFVELKNIANLTEVKVKHSLDVVELILSISADGKSHNLKMSGKNFTSSIKQEIDLTDEVTATILQQDGGNVITLASGVINPRCPYDNISPIAQSGGVPAMGALKSILNDTAKSSIDRQVGFRTHAAREIDEVLRAICTVDDKGKGICESCPYREFFYGENVDGGTNPSVVPYVSP